MEILKLILESNAFNFLILVFLLGLICKKLNLKEKLENAQTNVKNKIETSANEKEESIKTLINTNEKLQHTQEEIQEIIKQGEKNIEAIKNKISNETNKQINDIKENVEKIINAEEKDISYSLSKTTAIAAIEVAKKHIKDVLEKKPQYHETFIEESINQLETGLNK